MKESASASIPFQLQLLFARLQLTEHTGIETTVRVRERESERVREREREREGAVFIPHLDIEAAQMKQQASII